MRRPRVSRAALSKVGVFALSTLLASAVSVATIPVLIARAGATSWADLAVGQAVGTVLAVFVAFGWGVTGPYAVAILEPAQVREYYLQSARIRTLLLLIGAIPAVVVVLPLVQREPAAAVLSALGVMAGNLGGGWLYVGRSRPNALLLLDTVPRVVALLLGAGLVLAGAPLVVFAAVQLLAALSTAGIAVGSALRLPRPDGPSPERHGLVAAIAVMREQISAVVVAITAALYVSAPLIAVSALAPSGTAVYAVADRITKFSLNGLNPVAQVLQGWVPSTGAAVLAQRCRTAFRVSLALGVAGAAVLAPLLLIGAPILTGGAVRLPVVLAVVFALVFAAIAVSRVVGLVCLVALQRVRSLAVSTVTGAVVGIVALAVLTPLAGVLGAALAFLASEIAVSVAQVLSMRTALRELERTAAA